MPVNDTNVMRLWRECGLPEWFLGNGGTNDKLVAFAASCAALGAQWQDIASAPKDLSVVLLYQPAGPGTAEAVGQGHRYDLHEHAYDKWVFQANGWRAEPTRWMPLPKPPLPAPPSEGG